MPTFRGIVVPVLVLVLFVGGAFTVYQVSEFGQQSAARGDGQTVTNETHIQQVGLYQLVDKATATYTTGFNESVTVYNSSDVQLTEGTDYEWNETEGTILFYSTANTQDGASYNITYTYFENTGDVKTLAGPLEVLTIAIGNLGYLAAGLALVSLLIGFAIAIAKFVGDSGPTTNR